MRFAAVQVPPQQQRTPAAELLRRLVTGQPLTPEKPASRSQDLPIDLDQRVRLVGEW
jgi:hypothetical protein